MNFFGNFSISKENKYKLNKKYQYLKVINSFKNQVSLNNVLYNKKHYNFYFYNKIAKSINRLNIFLEYFSFGKEKEKYLSFDFLSSFFVFRKKFNNLNLKNKMDNLNKNNLILLNNNNNFIFLKKRINKIIYLKKYKRFFTFLFIDDLFFLSLLNYNSLLNFKKLIIFDFLYFYLFFKNINYNYNVNNDNYKNLKMFRFNLYKKWYESAHTNTEKQYEKVFLFFLRFNRYRSKDNMLSNIFRSIFLKKSTFLEITKKEKRQYFIPLLSRLNLKMPRRSRFRIKKFVKKFVLRKKFKYKYPYKGKKFKKNMRKLLYIKRLKDRKRNSYSSFIKKVSSELINEKTKIRIKSIFKIYEELLNKKLKYKKFLLKNSTFKFFNIISKEYFRINKLILKYFLENISNMDILKNNDLKLNEESKYKIIFDNFVLNYNKFIQNFNKFNIKYYNKLSLNFLKYNKIIINKKKTSLNLFFYKKKRYKVNKKKIIKKNNIVNSIYNTVLRRKFIYINKKKIDFTKLLPREKTKKDILERKRKKIYFSNFFTNLYNINIKKNKKKNFYINKLKENNKISFNFLNINKFYSNFDFENIFNYRLNIFSNLEESILGLNTYLNYYPNMYFLTKFTDSFLISYNFDNKKEFLNIIDFFLSLFNYDSLFFFKYNQKNNRFPYYYSKSSKPYKLNNSKINLSFNYIYPKIYEYNYLKINNSIKNKMTYYSNFFIKHRNYYDSIYSIDLLFQTKKESLNNYLLGVYNKLIDNSMYFSSLLREDSESNYNSSNYIWKSMLDKDFEKINNVKDNSFFFQKDNNKKINSKDNFDKDFFITRDYIKFFFSFAKNSIKKSVLNILKTNEESKDKDSNDIINLNKKKIENLDSQIIRNKYTFEVFEKSNLYNFFLDIFLRKYNEKQNLKKLLNIDIFDFNYVLKLNNKFLNQFFGLLNKKKFKNNSKDLFLNFFNETNYSVYKSTKLNLNKENNKNNKSLNYILKMNLFNEYFFKKYDNFKDIFYLKLFFPKLLDYYKKRSLKFSNSRKFKTVKFSNDFYSINNLNKSVLKKRKLFSQFATRIPFKVNIYPLYISNFKRKKTKIYFFRKRSKLRYGQFYFLDLYNSYFSLTNIQLNKFMIEKKLSNYFDIDIYIKNLFFAFDLINIKKKDYLSDENNYYYNSSYFSNLIYNKIYINKLKIFFKDKNFHNITKNFDKKIFMDFSTSKLNYNHSLIDFNDSLFFQTNLFKFLFRVKKHKFFFNKYLFKVNKKLTINSLNFYYYFKSKNLNKNYFKLIKNEVKSKNNNYILYQYLTKYNQIKKNSIFLKKRVKRIFGRNSPNFFLFRSFFRHFKNVYNTMEKSGEKKNKILNYLMKKNLASKIFSKIKKKLINFRYIFLYKFFLNFMNQYNNKSNNKYNFFNLDYFNLIYLNKLDITNLNTNSFFLKIMNKNKNIKLFNVFNNFNFFFKKINSNLKSYNNQHYYEYVLFKLNSIDNLIFLDFLSNRKNYLIYISLNNLIEKKEILNKSNYLFNNKIRNKYLKDSIIFKLKLFSNNLIKNPVINLYKINYIKGFLNNLIFKSKLLNEVVLNIHKNINKFLNNKFPIKNLYTVFVNYLNNYMFKTYNDELVKLIIYKYKFNNIYIEIIKNKKVNGYLDKYNIYLVKKMNEFFGKLKYISYNLIYKTHEVKNISIYSPLDFSFSINSFIINYNSFFELKNSFNIKLKAYSKNFKNIGGVLLFKIGL